MTELASDGELRQAMGDAGRARVRSQYLWERKGERLDALYASVLHNTAPPMLKSVDDMTVSSSR